jgi:hypothetical protein
MLPTRVVAGFADVCVTNSVTALLLVVLSAFGLAARWLLYCLMLVSC